MKKVRVPCTCGKVIQLTVKPGDEGKKVTVNCKCGQQLRTQLPVAEPRSPFDDVLDLLKRAVR